MNEVTSLLTTTPTDVNAQSNDQCYDPTKEISFSGTLDLEMDIYSEITGDFIGDNIFTIYVSEPSGSPLSVTSRIEFNVSYRIQHLVNGLSATRSKAGR